MASFVYFACILAGATATIVMMEIVAVMASSNYAINIFMCQWVCLIALGINQWTDYTRGFCPNSGTITEKILMMGISAIYFVRSSLLLRKNMASTFENEAKLLADRAEDSVFDFYTRLDWLHQFSHQILSTLFNLWIICCQGCYGYGAKLAGN